MQIKFFLHMHPSNTANLSFVFRISFSNSLANACFDPWSLLPLFKAMLTFIHQEENHPIFKASFNFEFELGTVCRSRVKFLFLTFSLVCHLFKIFRRINSVFYSFTICLLSLSFISETVILIQDHSHQGKVTWCIQPIIYFISGIGGFAISHYVNCTWSYLMQNHLGFQTSG